MLIFQDFKYQWFGRRVYYLEAENHISTEKLSSHSKLSFSWAVKYFYTSENFCIVSYSCQNSKVSIISIIYFLRTHNYNTAIIMQTVCLNVIVGNHNTVIFSCNTNFLLYKTLYTLSSSVILHLKSHYIKAVPYTITQLLHNGNL